ncbi:MULTISPECIES: GntR family transcriptional regulator [Lonsdalea]|uniref:GntR family transcriptional regulator n=3 Tax=Lonsdalea TaxID=1082702 RepID=A0ACD1JGW7_9GAMM|nr:MULTISPECIES: GntR family transcriptional regulator [Lonsdalea]OSM97469.1 GntR family transcriptional regulator [Lonsdalea populi]OSN01828.1 GntR family transcriptional regulator [Lonsdalea populi]QPQ23931.1 GntR family transcriptional regulator [Lonsdalea populi]RAT16681.1 GntR family transcriptional regulator [Lonsdalea quercina]RAT16860.1 GntR family transcriptional regulator [Lonsdalea quercina]
MEKFFIQLRSLLDKPSSAPRYMQLAEALELAIQQRRDLSGHFLPPERQLVQLLGLSRVTVSRSLALLEHKGLILRQQGVGTRIVLQIGYALTSDEPGFSALVHERGGVASNNWLERITDVAITPTLALTMHLPASTVLTKLRRVRLLNDEPASLETVWIPQRWLPKPEEIEHSLYGYWRERQIFPENRRYRLRAVSATREISKLLKVPNGMPLLFSRQHTFDAKGELLEYCEIYCRSDVYEFEVSD